MKTNTISGRVVITILLFHLGFISQISAKQRFCRHLFSSKSSISLSGVEKPKVRRLTRNEIENLEDTIKSKKLPEDSRAFQLHIISTLSSVVFTYLNWQLTGYPIPLYLPKITFRRPETNDKYQRVRTNYHWLINGAHTLYLVTHPKILLYFVEALFLPFTGFDIVEHQDKITSLNEGQTRAWESWKQAFFDTEGRWPNPTKYPQDLGEWMSEHMRIQSYTLEDIKVRHSK